MWLLQVVTGVELRGALDFARCQRLSVQCVLLSMSVQFVRSSMVIIGRLSGLILQRAQQRSAEFSCSTGAQASSIETDSPVTSCISLDKVSIVCKALSTAQHSRV